MDFFPPLAGPTLRLPHTSSLSGTASLFVAEDEAALKAVLADLNAASEREVAEARSKLEAALTEADILRKHCTTPLCRQQRCS
jgi:hypothetical protein